MKVEAPLKSAFPPNPPSSFENKALGFENNAAVVLAPKRDPGCLKRLLLVSVMVSSCFSSGVKYSGFDTGIESESFDSVFRDSVAGSEGLRSKILPYGGLIDEASPPNSGLDSALAVPPNKGFDAPDAGHPNKGFYPEGASKGLTFAPADANGFFHSAGGAPN